MNRLRLGRLDGKVVVAFRVERRVEAHPIDAGVSDVTPEDVEVLGLSLGRHYEVAEPLPAPGTAEIWSFVVQYVYQNQPYGQMSQPVSITVRG